MTPKELYVAAGARHHDALQKLLDKLNAADTSAELTQARAEQDALLTSFADYLNQAAATMEAAVAPAAAAPAEPAPAPQ